MRYAKTILMMGLAGCAPIAADQTPLTADHVVAARVLGEEARGNVIAAKPFSNPVGYEHLEAADEQLQRQSQEHEKALAANAATARQVQAMELRIDEYHRAFLSDRQRAIIWWVVGIWLVVGVGAALLSALTGGLPAVIGGNLLQLIPLAQPFLWLVQILGKH